MDPIETRIAALEKRLEAMEGVKKEKKPRAESEYNKFVKEKYNAWKDLPKYASYEGKARFIAITKDCAAEWKKK